MTDDDDLPRAARDARPYSPQMMDAALAAQRAAQRAEDWRSTRVLILTVAAIIAVVFALFGVVCAALGLL